MEGNDIYINYIQLEGKALSNKTASPCYSTSKCILRRLLSSSTKPALPSAVRRVDHVRSSSPVCRSPLSQRLSISRHAPSQSLGWFLKATSLTQPSTPNLSASLCQLEATGVTTSSSMSLMSGVDEMSRRARAPERGGELGLH